MVKVKALPYFLRTRKLELFLISSHCSSGECVVIATWPRREGETHDTSERHELESKERQKVCNRTEATHLTR